MNIAVDTFKIFAAGVGVGIGVSCLTMITIKAKKHEIAVKKECDEKLDEIAREEARKVVKKREYYYNLNKES